MDELEYQEKLMECVAFKKWQVITDAALLLNNMNHNFEAVIAEIKAERKAIIKMLESNISNKQKLDFINSILKKEKTHDDKKYNNLCSK